MSPKASAILDLLSRGVADHHVASRTGVSESYVRAVRSRYTTKDAKAYWKRIKGSRQGSSPQSDFAPGLILPAPARVPRYRPAPPRQSREELRALAETFCRWRAEGRWA